MVSRSEARALRKEQSQAKFDERKASSINKVLGTDAPRSEAFPEQPKTPRVAPHIARSIERVDRTPKTQVNGSRFSSSVTWCQTKADIGGKWSWGELRQWADEEWAVEIQPFFAEMSKLTWKEVDDRSSESGHKMHHGHELSDLVGEAQARWIEHGLEEFDSVFRFRLGGRKRVWGLIVQAHFHLVWWDRTHSIYPVG